MDEGRRKRDASGAVNAEVLHSRGAPRLVSALLTPAVLPVRSQTLATSGTGATSRVVRQMSRVTFDFFCSHGSAGGRGSSAIGRPLTGLTGSERIFADHENDGRSGPWPTLADRFPFARGMALADALRMRPPRLLLFAAFVCVAVISPAASFDDRVEALFRPPLGEMTALSPDGQRVAYTSHRGADLTIVIANVESPGPRRTVKVESGRDAAPEEDRPPAQLRFMRWATAGRLVYAPVERVVPLPAVVDQQGRAGPNPDGPAIIAPILAVDADGKERGALVDASYFQETPAEARRSLADLLRTTKELAVVRQESVRWRMPHLDILV